MSVERELEIAAKNLMTAYLGKIRQSPAIFFPLAESILHDANSIRRKFSRQAEQIEYVSKQLLMVMSRSLFIQNLFCEAVKKQNFSRMNEADLLAQADSFDLTSGVTSGDLWGILHQTILKGVRQGDSIEEIYYERYFVEYSSNLLEINLIQGLSKDSSMMSSLKQSILDHGGTDIIYQMFIKVLDEFKDKLPLENYQYRKILRMK